MFLMLSFLDLLTFFKILFSVDDRDMSQKKLLENGGDDDKENLHKIGKYHAYSVFPTNLKGHVHLVM